MRDEGSESWVGGLRVSDRGVVDNGKVDFWPVEDRRFEHRRFHLIRMWGLGFRISCSGFGV